MRVLCVLTALLALTNCTILAQTKVGQTTEISSWLTSPRSAGMGGCTINLVDPNSVIDNPGVIGLMHLNRFASFSFPSSTDWLSGYDDLVVRNHGFSFGVSSTSLWNRRTALGNVSFGFAYYRTHYDYAPWYQTSYERSQGYGYVDRDDWSHEYSIGVGIEQRARLGIGYTYRQVSNRWYSDIWTCPTCCRHQSVSGHTSDLGLILEVPLSEMILEGPSDSKRLYPDVGISGAYVIENVGGVSGQSAIPQQPESECEGIYLDIDGTNRYGFSVWGSAYQNLLEVASLRLCLQGDVSRSTTSFGMEIGALDIVALRLGRIDRGGTGKGSTGTSGFGVNLGGIVRMLSYVGVIKTENRLLRHVVDNLDISYDYSSRMVDLPFEYTGKREYWKFSLSL